MTRVALASCATLPDWEVDDRPLHAALRARGAEVSTPAWDDPRVDWRAFDACLIRTTWDYTARRDAFVAWAEACGAVTRLVNPAGVVRWNTHKRYLHDLEARGVPVIDTVWLERGASADVGALARERGWRRAFLKPAIGATARETLRFDAGEAGLAAARAHVERLLPDEDMLLQPYLSRVETEGELSAIFLGGRFSHAVRKVPVAGDYRVQDDFHATDGPAELSDAERRLAEDIVAAAESARDLWARHAGDQLLYARVDLLRDAAGALRLTELELVEPSLFFRHAPGAAERIADALLAAAAL